MLNSEIISQSHGEFLKQFTSEIPRASFAELFATQLEITPYDKKDSRIISVLTTLIEARKSGIQTELLIDERYVKHITRVNDRDFPNWWISLTKDEREQRRANAASTRVWLKELEDTGVLQYLHPRTQPSSHSSWLRILTSKHVGQHWAAVHYKGGFIFSECGSSATLTTGNLTSSDVDTMSNIAIRFSGERGQTIGKHIKTLISPDTKLRNAGGHIWKETVDDWITILHDYNNVGDPARLPFIHIVAEKLIDPSRNEFILKDKFTPPKPKIIVYCSQYTPDGKLAIMLNQAQKNSETTVFIPKQPPKDHRRSAFPYNILTKTSCINRNEGYISSPDREQPSHVKCLLVKYNDNTAAILFGSDNYLTHLQKFVRNEEMAVLIEITANSEEQLTFYNNFRLTLLKTGEIDEETYSSLDLSAGDDPQFEPLLIKSLSHFNKLMEVYQSEGKEEDE